MRFKHNACEDGVTCAVGAIVFVQEHLPYLGKQRRATSISATPAPTAADAVLFVRLDRALIDRITREIGRFFDPRPFEGVSHFDRVLAQLGIAVDTSVLAVGEEPLGVIHRPEELVAWTPFDPCFVAFGGRDGDAWGAMCHPALLARGEAPIAHWSHAGAPIRFEAATFAEWAAQRTAARERDDDDDDEPAALPPPPLATAVRAIVAGSPPGLADEQRALAAYLEYLWTDFTREPRRGAGRRTEQLAWPAVLVERRGAARAGGRRRAAHAAAVARITREHPRGYPDHPPLALSARVGLVLASPPGRV